MKNAVSITDLQRQDGQIIGSLSDSDEPVIVTQNGRAAAVILSVSRYEEIEDGVKHLDELELMKLVTAGKRAIKAGDVISHEEVKRKLKLPTHGSLRKRKRKI
jgi:prevent-host-death family protein